VEAVVAILLIVLLVVAPCGAGSAYLWLRLRSAREALERFSGTVKARDAQIGLLKKEVETLKPFTAVQNAAEEADKIIATARQEADRIHAQAKEFAADEQRMAEHWSREYISGAESQAREILEVARQQAISILDGSELELESVKAEIQAQKQKLKDITEKTDVVAEQWVGGAKREAESIIRNANDEAQRIAGTALRAQENADELGRMVLALENKISGYGNQYLIPGRDLLSGLAEEYDHTAAAEDLKRVRSKIQKSIRNGHAATCGYVEPYRKETAIQFVTDAFNGKVDSILSRVKSDNYGKLAQEIKDAAELVNVNGRAFKDAKVAKDFLALRLEELRAACTLHEIKELDKEEQRRIKERIREEEKARREYEAAIKQAGKEEEAIKKALDKARAEAAEAGEAQRLSFEARIKEMEEKLAAAEAKSQRALSMAQQTKTGHVYVISNVGSFGEDVYKIGMTRRLEPLDRVKELGDASVPFEFDVHGMIYSTDAPGLERELHKRFAMKQVNKVNPRKEFFRLDLTDIRSVVDEMGLNEVHWTMAAEARQYKETLAIEDRISKSDEAAQAWLSQQTLPEDTDDEVISEAA